MKRWAPLVIGLSVIAGVAAWHFLRADPQSNAFKARHVATRALAEYVAGRYSGQRAVIVSNPFVPIGLAKGDIAQMEEAGTAGIKEGLGSKVICEAVAYPELTPAAREDPHAVPIGNGATTPLSFLVTTDSFDKLAAKFPECDLMISLIGLPAELHAVQCWHTPGEPAFALLLPDVQLIGVAEIRRAVKEGKLAAFVLSKPGAVDSRTPVSRDWKAEFDKRYLLVTAENIEQAVSDYPQLFRAR